MKKKYVPVLVILVGMILTHLFFTVMIYRSGLHLNRTIGMVMDAGYLPVPNAYILPNLRSLGTAFKSAVFFTLTVGIALPFLVYLAACAWDRGYRRNRLFLIILSGFVILCMVMLNRHGFNPIVTLWFLSVYFLTFKLTLFGLVGVQTRLSTKRLLTHIATLAILGVLWTTLSPGNVFFNVRDYLLLSNSFGKRITDFYYKFSPYPTESIKPLLKKQIKTYRIDGDFNESVLHKLKSILLRYDYLTINAAGAADIHIQAHENSISFVAGGRTVLRTAIDTFMGNPGAVLNRVSTRSDRNNFTRRLLAFSLLFALPVFLYVCVFFVFHLIFRHFFNSDGDTGFFTSAVGCLIVGIAAMFIFRVIAPVSMPLSHLKAALRSENPVTRMTAFRTIALEGLDPSDYCPDTLSSNRPYIPERIWWTISLSNNTEPGTNDVLLRLLNDPYPLVACKAYDSLKNRLDRAATRTIIQKIKTSRDWYVQGYAYQTLRSLGWEQKASN